MKTNDDGNAIEFWSCFIFFTKLALKSTQVVNQLLPVTCMSFLKIANIFIATYCNCINIA